MLWNLHKRKAFLAVFKFNIILCKYVSKAFVLKRLLTSAPWFAGVLFLSRNNWLGYFVMLLLENPKVILFRIAFYKVYYSTDTNFWQILDAKDLRMTGVTSHSTQIGAKRRNRVIEQSMWNIKISPDVTLHPHVPKRSYQYRSDVCNT